MKHLYTLLTILVSISQISFIYGQSDALSAVYEYLDIRATELNLDPDDIQNMILTDQYVTTHSGVSHLYFKQHHNGIAVNKAILNANIDSDLNILNIYSRFIPGLNQLNLPSTPGIDQADALLRAAQHLSLAVPDNPVLVSERNDATQHVIFDDAGLLMSDIPIYLTYQNDDNDKVKLVWTVELYTLDGNHFWNVKVDAVNGTIISVEDEVLHCNFTKDNSDHAAIPNAASSFFESEAENLNFDDNNLNYAVYPHPIESPNHGSRSVLNDPSDPIASPFGWHDTDGATGADYTITRGNNVYAKDDIAGDNEETIGSSPDGGVNLDFIFPLDPQEEPETYIDASITNLFYWNNIIHDIWYQYGFDEASGNFQENNYGRGGLGEDPVQADAMDGSGTNNANFFTPAEPDTMDRDPRMQMFLWTGVGAGTRFLSINSPMDLVGVYDATRALFGPELPDFANAITGDVVLVDDGTATPNSGCSPIQNTSEVNGNIALLNVGGCGFVDKVQNAQDAGAIGVVVCFTFPGNPVTMIGESTTITIPSIMIDMETCNNIKMALPGVNVSLSMDPANGPGSLDSDLDNGVIVHEYGHGISNRLTGGPAERECLRNMEQMGEGWSDFLALIMTMNPGDVGDDARGIGTYLSTEPIRGGGIRPYPYSTNFFVNPHTYRNIATEFAPHGSGSVWCGMIWEMTWALIELYGFDPDIYHGTGGNNIALQLVIDGMKLQPCSPGFVDGRDAILMADEINNGGANKCLIWKAFAKRGLGAGADQGDSDIRTDGIEGFDLPPECVEELTISKSISIEDGSPGDTVTFQLSIFNGSDDVLTNNVVTDTLPDGVTYVEGSINCGSNISAGIVTIPLGTLMPQDQITCSFQVTIDEAFFTTYLFLDNMESGASNWVIDHGLGQDDWELRDANAFSGDFAWYCRNVDLESDQYLTLASPISLTGDNLRLRFQHSYRTEARWDGGVIEISSNGGAWQDLGPNIIQNGYAGVLESANPIGPRDAFWGSSNGYITTVVDLSQFDGDDILIRFRFASDDQLGNVGWYLDDVTIANEAVIPNTACVTNDQGFDACDSIFDPPVIDESFPVSVNESIPEYDVFLYPNPTSGRVHIGASGDIFGKVSISVLGINGKVLHHKTIDASDLKAHFPLDLLNISSGIYIVKIETNETSILKKLIYQ